jgi:peptidoglycan/LPS O-acetylase OafA/YrhL
MSKAHQGMAFYTLPGRVFEFQSGVFIAVALNRGFRIRNLLFVGTCIFLIFCTLIFGYSHGDLVAIFTIILGTLVIL